MDPLLISQQDDSIQSLVLEAPWFKSSRRLCAYISCPTLREVDTSKVLAHILEGKDGVKRKFYVPRVEDKNNHMRMLHISSVDDIVVNSMDILEPAAVDADGNEREDGLAFDRSGRRLGRGGGPYLDKEIRGMIRSTAEPTFSEYIGTFHIKEIEFERLSLGSIPPILNGLKVYETNDKELIEPSIKWAGNPDIVVVINICSLPIRLQLEDLQIFLAPRIPLVPAFPCFANIVVSLMEKISE